MDCNQIWVVNEGQLQLLRGNLKNTLYVSVLLELQGPRYEFESEGATLILIT